MQKGLGYQAGSHALGCDPGNAILLSDVQQTANLEIGVPGFEHPPPQINFGFRS
jgi:hypothetical protein